MNESPAPGRAIWRPNVTITDRGIGRNMRMVQDVQLDGRSIPVTEISVNDSAAAPTTVTITFMPSSVIRHPASWGTDKAEAEEVASST